MMRTPLVTDRCLTDDELQQLNDAWKEMTRGDRPMKAITRWSTLAKRWLCRLVDRQ
jgi:hypothetical protein